MGQIGFYDLDKRLEAISAKGDPLELIEATVPWESFRAEIEAVTRAKAEERKSAAGRKHRRISEVENLRQKAVHPLERAHVRLEQDQRVHLNFGVLGGFFIVPGRSNK